MSDIPDETKRLLIAKIKEEASKLFKAADVSKKIDQ